MVDHRCLPSCVTGSNWQDGREDFKMQDPLSSQIVAGSLPETQLQDSHKEINKTSCLESKGLSEEAPWNCGLSYIIPPHTHTHSSSCTQSSGGFPGRKKIRDKCPEQGTHACHSDCMDRWPAWRTCKESSTRQRYPRQSEHTRPPKPQSRV